VSWAFYLGSVLFFTVLFGVLLAVGWSVALGVHENYLRYYQKERLQWTGPQSRFPRKSVPIRWLLPVAFLGAWLVVHFVVMP